jgi:pectinesterase
VLKLTVTNPVAIQRDAETIALALADLIKVAPKIDLSKTVVTDATGKIVLSQVVDLDGNDTPDQLVFQTDLGPSESKTFSLKAADRPMTTEEDYKVYGRFVRERHDDFAWENDIVAHRVYGPDLETYKGDPLTSSGVDVWVKHVPRLVVNKWYMTDHYHDDMGEGADFYSVKKTRGCGGLGIWSGGKLHVSRNFTGSHVYANGPIRLIFELKYAAWDAGGAKVSETRRVTLDAGSHFNRVDATLEGGKPGLTVGIGISKHPGNVEEADPKGTWIRTWEPLSLNGEAKGSLGCAVVLPPSVKSEVQQIDTDYLVTTPLPKSGPLTYYAGTAWDRGPVSNVADAAAWTKAVQTMSTRAGNPVAVSLAAPASK